MNKDSFANTRLNKIRKASLLKALILTVVLFAIEFLIFFTYNYFENTIFDFLYIKDDQLRVLGRIIYLIVITSLNSLIVIYYFIKMNTYYRKENRAILFSECQLEDLYLIERKVENDKEIILEKEKYFNVEKLKYLQAFSDASPQISITYNRIKYVKNHRHHIGMLFSMTFQNDSQFLIKLSQENKFLTDLYHDEIILNYGFNNNSLLKDYVLFTNNKDAIKVFSDNANAKKLYLLNRYFNRNCQLLIYKNNFDILIPDFKMFYANGLLIRRLTTDYEDKIDALKHIHKLWTELYKMVEENLLD